MSGSLVDVLRAMPVVLKGVSGDGAERVLRAVVRAGSLPPEAFRSSHFDGGSIRKELRMVAALLPQDGKDLVRAMWLLIANKQADWDDVAALLEDRRGEAPLGDLKVIVSGLRDGLTAREVHEQVGVALGKVQEVSMFLGTRDSRVSVIQETAFAFAAAEAEFQAFVTVNGFTSRQDAREPYWAALLAAHRMITPFEEAALGLIDTALELADVCAISTSRARKYLAEARAVVRELQVA
jgi:hypothetical protein